MDKLIDYLIKSERPTEHFRFPGRPSHAKMRKLAAVPQFMCVDAHSVTETSLLDRSTTIGHMIDEYLRNKADLDDMAIHLLFSANRWEAA